MDLLQALLAPLVLLLQLLQLHPQVLPLLAELVLQLLERRLRLGQLHLQALLQQRDLRRNRRSHKHVNWRRARYFGPIIRDALLLLFRTHHLLITDGCSSGATLKQINMVQQAETFITGDRMTTGSCQRSRSGCVDEWRFVEQRRKEKEAQEDPELCEPNLNSSCFKPGPGKGHTCSSRSSTFLCQLSLALASSCSLLCANCASAEALSSS